MGTSVVSGDAPTFQFHLPHVLFLSEPSQMLPGGTERKKFPLVNFSFESSKKSKIVTVSQESSIGVCQT